MQDFLDCCHRQWRHEHVDRRQGINDCRFAAEAVRDDLGLSVVTGHVGLFQRLHRANSELVCRRSNLAGHWARIGVVGAPRAVWRAGSIILAGIIKQRRSAIPTYAASNPTSAAKHKEMSDVSNVLAKAAHALRAISQRELADVVVLLALLATAEDVAAARRAILAILDAPPCSRTKS